MNKAVYWFTQDLRLSDNKLLNALLGSSKHMAFVYVIDPTWFEPRNYQHKSIGLQRWLFLCQSLRDLNQQLINKGHHLWLLEGDPSEQIQNVIQRNNIDCLGVANQVGWYEQQAVRKIRHGCPSLDVQSQWHTTLFNEDSMMDDMPMSSFSRFRQYVEKHDIPVVETIKCGPISWPAIITDSLVDQIPLNFEQRLNQYTQRFKFNNNKEVQANTFFGGEHNAIRHLHDYFSTDAAMRYKQTRNALDGWASSTKLSPYLALGNLCPRKIWQYLKRYEAQNGKNESTYWIGFELLWREYFQWLLLQKSRQFFMFQGHANEKPLTSYYSERFTKWCQGSTPYPLVNACMRQLNATGYISNRGRQIVASCLVNELSVDWRFGAAYFQQQLIDYDVASNWGNWQYIAGVGVDPRGGRHFNLNTQTQMYDPNGDFVKKWGGQNTVPIDSVDAADWPIL